MIKGVVIGVLLTVLVGAGGIYYYFASGMAPVATADPPMPFEKRLAHMALDAHIEKQTVGQPPVAADESAYLAGAEVYKSNAPRATDCPASRPATMRQPCIPNRRSCSGVRE